MMLAAALTGASTCQAALVTFDFRVPQLTELHPSDPVVSDYGTQLFTNSTKGGIPQNSYVVDPQGGGPSFIFDVFAQVSVGYFPVTNFANNNEIYVASYSFGHPVQLVSADFLLRVQNIARVDFLSLLGNTYDFLPYDSSQPLPQARTISFSNRPLEDTILIRSGGASDAFSLVSLTVEDPTVSAVPEPASLTVFAGLALMGVAGASWRRRRASSSDA
jgi:MYXO-CTERM domain-containing protein